MLQEIYSLLLESFGPQGWWPVKHSFSPPEWEVMVGAVLTQNTAWRNVEKALEALAENGITSRDAILSVTEARLAELIKPSGYFNQKARKLRVLASLNGSLSREGLLGLWGIGPETADSIMLYAAGEPLFVVDAYTRRVFSRLGLIKGGDDYETIRETFERALPRDVELFREYHALIVRLAKENCKKKPNCGSCPLGGLCMRVVNP